MKSLQHIINAHDNTKLMITYRIIVYGHVQGVGYRAFIYNQARKLNLNGSVKNMFDGSVQIIIQGPEISSKRLIELSKNGPTLSHVTDIKIFEEDKEIYTDFHIE